MKFTHLIPGAAGAVLLCAFAHAAAVPSAYAFYNAHTLPKSAVISIDEREWQNEADIEGSELPLLTPESHVFPTENTCPADGAMHDVLENTLTEDIGEMDDVVPMSFIDNARATGSNYAECNVSDRMGEEV